MTFFIATPNYNYGRFLRDTIESVRLQADVKVTHHIQDGCSTDNTSQTVEASQWSGLTYVTEPDRGQCDAVNRAFKRAPQEAEFVGWLNSDEYYLPGALAAVRRVFMQQPSVDVVYGDSIHVDERGGLLRLVAQHGFSRAVLRSMKHLYIQSSSAFFRRRLLDEGELYLDPKYRQTMDLDLFARLDHKGLKFGYIGTPLSCFRIHDSQLTAQHGAELSMDEAKQVAESIGYTRWPLHGRAVHRLYKVAYGAYWRELRAQQIKGSSTCWFDGAGTQELSRLM